MTGGEPVDRLTWPTRRVLLARCPKCDRQHQFYSEAQIERMLARGSCKFCATPPGAGPGRWVLRYASRGQDEPSFAWEWWEDAWGECPWDASDEITPT